MHCLEFHDVEAVGEDAVGFAFEQMLGFVGGDVTDSRENIGGVGAGTFDAITVVDAALACFVVDIKKLQVVVKVNGTGAEVSAQEGGVCGEDGGDVDASFSAEGKTNTS